LPVRISELGGQIPYRFTAAGKERFSGGIDQVPLEFRYKIEPEADLADRIAELTPDNPFYTSKYNEVRRRLGSTPCLFWIEEDGRLVTGCSAFLSKGWLNSRIEITSLPPLPHPDLFWRGVFDLCRKESITAVSVQTFASTTSQIPALASRTSVRNRCEYRLDLAPDDLLGGNHRLHQRKIRAATGAGLKVRQGSDETTLLSHVDLANKSLDRRRGRGYSINSQIELAEASAFIETGAGSIYQAVLGNKVISTMLIARSRTGGYAQSSGTSDTGRDLGASHFLFYQTACLLKEEGFETFNLGGADDKSKGLQDFKLGTGAVRIDLESADFYVGSQLKRIATKAATFLFGG
jgi:hypothetical protein